jgi:hypothetical protein
MLSSASGVCEKEIEILVSECEDIYSETNEASVG